MFFQMWNKRTRTIFTWVSRLAILAFSASLYGLLKTCPVVALLVTPDNSREALGNVLDSHLRCCVLQVKDQCYYLDV